MAAANIIEILERLTIAHSHVEFVPREIESAISYHPQH